MQKHSSSPLLVLARKTVPPGFYILTKESGAGGVGIIIADAKWMNFDRTGQCLANGILEKLRGPFWTFHSEANHGYGPSLYDAALICAAEKGKWLVPALTSNLLVTEGKGATTSDEAEAVWKFYYEHRPDVKKHDISKLTEDLFLDRPWMSTAYQLHGTLESIAPLWDETKTEVLATS